MKLETFFEKFNLFADAPNAVQAFREIVLQLAVRGRLTRQGANESSLEQLVCAEAFRTRRGRRGEPDIEDVPFPVPGSWSWAAVGDTMDMVNGKAFKPDDWSAEGTPIIRIQNLNNVDASFNRCKAELDPRFHVHDGDFLISWSGTPGTSFGAFIWNRGFAYLNQHIFRCELVEGVFAKEFLRLAVNARLDEMISQAHGAVGLRHITKGKLESIRLPLPPLVEQRRIVAKVNELMVLCDRLDSQQQERETRRATLARASLARFADAPTAANLNFLFHDSYAIEPADLRACIVTLALQGRLTSGTPAPLISMEGLVGQANLRNGLSLSPTAGEAAFSCLPLSAMRAGEVDCGRGKPVSLTAERAAPYLIRKGDIFVIRGNGSKDLVGRAGIVREEPRSVIFPDLFIRVPVPRDRMLGDFFLLAWNSPPMRDTIHRLARTTSGIWKINQGHIAECEVPLPPLGEQRRIVARVAQLMTRVDELERQLASSHSTAARLLAAIVSELTNAVVAKATSVR